MVGYALVPKVIRRASRIWPAVARVALVFDSFRPIFWGSLLRASARRGEFRGRHLGYKGPFAAGKGSQPQCGPTSARETPCFYQFWPLSKTRSARAPAAIRSLSRGTDVYTYSSLRAPARSSRDVRWRPGALSFFIFSSEKGRHGRGKPGNLVTMEATGDRPPSRAPGSHAVVPSPQPFMR
jgi:hypothetical protein